MQRIYIFLAIVVILLAIGQSFLFYGNIQANRQSHSVSDELPDCDIELHTRYPSSLQIADSETEVTPLLIWLEPISNTVTNTTYYPIKFQPFRESLYFTDQEGLPLAPQLQATISDTALIFVRQAPVSVSHVITQSIYLDTADDCHNLHTEIEIQLESSTWSTIRYIINMFFGTTTSILAIIALVGNFTIQHFFDIYKTRQAQEERRREGLQQTIESIRDIKHQVKTDTVLAIQGWYGHVEKLKEESEQNQNWLNVIRAYFGKKQEARITIEVEKKQNALDEIAKDLRKEAWQFALLEKAVNEKCNGNHGSCRQTVELLATIINSERLQAEDEGTQQSLIAADLLCDRDIREICREYDDSVVAATLIWLYQNFDLKVQSIIEQNLIEAFKHNDIIVPVLKEFIDSKVIDQIAILATGNFDDTIANLEKEHETYSSDIQKSIASLASLKKLNLQWPRVWARRGEPVPNLVPPVSTYFDKNPFSIDTAELESDSYSYYVPSSVDGELYDQTINIFYGKIGSGKTTAAFRLYKRRIKGEEPSISHIFPIYWNVSPPLELAIASVIQLIQAKVAEQLIQFLALNPRTFLDCSLTRKIAIKTLLIHNFHSMEAILGRLELFSLGQNNLAKRFTQDLHSTRIIDIDRLNPDIDLLGILKNALPAEFDVLYLMIDISSAQLDKYGSYKIAYFINRIIDHTTDLMFANIYPKFFLPDTLHTQLHLPSYVKTSTIEYSPEQMAQILQQRLIKAGNKTDDLNRVFTIDSGQVDINQAVITAAQNSPRRLIQRMDRLFRHTNWPQDIDAQTIQQMLKHD